MPHPWTHVVADVLPLTFEPLTIRGVITATPPDAGRTDQVRLQLSRPLTIFEVQALRSIARGMQPVRDELLVHGTTPEKVAQQAPRLASLVRQAELDGRGLEREAKRRAAREVAERAGESARLAALAHSIRCE